MTADSPITGECFCGQITYELQGTLRPGRSCHCSRCRKAFSGAGSAITILTDNNFRWTGGEGLLKLYENMFGIGLAFCSTCGTSLCTMNNGEVFAVTLGTLNGDPPVQIGEHIFVGSKACWDEIGGPAPQFDEWPEQATK